MGTLQDKVAVVTGASRGIGRAIAERLAREGALVVINYAGNHAAAEEAVRTIESEGGRSIAVRADVSKLSEVRRLFSSVQERFGQLDIVVAGAATTVFKPHGLVTEEEFDRIFNLNTKGTYFVLQEAAQRISDGGRIVAISSAGTAGHLGGAGLYLGSKVAVEQFAGCLSKELGARQVTVNALSPGMTDTDGLIMPKEAVAQAVATTPLGRLGKPVDIANAVAFLVGPDGAWVTGQNLRVTGGLI